MPYNARSALPQGSLLENHPKVREIADSITLLKQKKDLSELDSQRKKILNQFANLKKRHDFFARQDQAKE